MKNYSQTNYFNFSSVRESANRTEPKTEPNRKPKKKTEPLRTLISNQICDERTKFDILYAFVNVSLCLTHRKHSLQRALDSPGSGERFKYVERARKVYRKFFRDI